MPEGLSQATPAEPVSPPSVQAPETATPAVSTQPESQTEQKPITLEDYRRIAREEATRVAQSQVAKGENRIQKLIQDKFAALDQTKGILGLDDKQVADARQKIVTEAYSAAEPEPTPPPAGEQPQGMGPGHPIYDFTTEFFQAEGLDVKATDPEFKLIQAALDDPDGSLGKYSVVLHKAISQKRERLDLQKETADARTLGGGTSPTTKKPLTAEEKISAGLQSGNWQSQEPPRRS